VTDPAPVPVSETVSGNVTGVGEGGENPEIWMMTLDGLPAHVVRKKSLLTGSKASPQGPEPRPEANGVIDGVKGPPTGSPVFVSMSRISTVPELQFTNIISPA
jgi:hypothetical protein